MSGQAANQTRSETISRLKSIERGPTKSTGMKNPNHGSGSMNPMIPTNNKTAK